MALTISKLKMWRDPGYTRNCPEMPPLGSWKLPAADYTLAADQTLRPHKDSTLTSLNLPLSFTQVFGMSYLYIEASDGAGSVSMFGWITSIEQRSTSAEGVTIRWDADWWRTYSGSATLGAGQVIKCSNSSYKRPYRTQPRYWKSQYSYKIKSGVLTPDTNSVWLYVLCVWTTDATEVISTIKTLFCPVNTSFIAESGGSAKTGMDLSYLFRGKLDEFVDAMGGSGETAKIIGAWLAPLAPNDFAWDTANSRWYQTGSAGDGYTTYTKDGWTLMKSRDDRAVESKTSSIIALAADATHRVVITDCDGNISCRLPDNINSSGYRAVLDIGANGGYLCIYFIANDLIPSNMNEPLKNTISNSLGLGCTIPLPSIPVTENQWSDYMVTGQRDFDITSARIANDQRAVAGLESAASSVVGGGVTGASAGPMGAVAGMIGGGAISGIMTGINYGLGENFNHQLQEAKDKLYANQKNGIMLTGNSYNKIVTNKAMFPMIFIQEADTVSAAEYTADITLNGYDTDIPVANVGTFITGTTGPYRIRNLTVTGNIPPQAKQYIKDKFETGVRIVENNPSGVTP